MADASVSRAIDLFNRRDFVAAGELFEEIQRAATAEAQPLYDAILRIAAGLHLRMSRGGERGTLNLLQQALVRLDDLRPTCAGIDTEALYADTSAYADRIRANPGAIGWWERQRFPKIRQPAS
jgi:hypothetical protein